MSSSSTKKYDVFINFRGLDTRIHFISHLHSALLSENFDTYIDDLLEKGEEVWPALCQAIENSQIAIIVFSKDYASSKWCLDELVKILECRKNKYHRLVVIPVFYEVEPSHVRYQIESYKEAFAKHDRFVRDEDGKSMREKVSKWKQALTEAADISGWHCRSRDYKSGRLVVIETSSLRWCRPLLHTPQNGSGSHREMAGLGGVRCRMNLAAKRIWMAWSEWNDIDMAAAAMHDTFEARLQDPFNSGLFLMCLLSFHSPSSIYFSSRRVIG